MNGPQYTVQCSKVTVTYDELCIKYVSHSLDPVYEDVCTFMVLSLSIVSLWFSVSGSVFLAVLRSKI